MKIATARPTHTVIPAEAGIHLRCLVVSTSRNQRTYATFIPGGEGSNPHEVFRRGSGGTKQVDVSNGYFPSRCARITAPTLASAPTPPSTSTRIRRSPSLIDRANLHMPQLRPRPLKQISRIGQLCPLVEPQVHPPFVWQDIGIPVEHLPRPHSIRRGSVPKADHLARMRIDVKRQPHAVAVTTGRNKALR